MGNELEVNPGGLRAAGAEGEAVAGTLADAAVGGTTGAQPSAAGVTAMDSAVSAIRNRQSARVYGQAGDLSAAGARYDDTDGDSAEDISVTI